MTQCNPLTYKKHGSVRMLNAYLINCVQVLTVQATVYTVQVCNMHTKVY